MAIPKKVRDRKRKEAELVKRQFGLNSRLPPSSFPKTPKGLTVSPDSLNANLVPTGGPKWLERSKVKGVSPYAISRERDKPQPRGALLFSGVVKSEAPNLMKKGKKP